MARQAGSKCWDAGNLAFSMKNSRAGARADGSEIPCRANGGLISHVLSGSVSDWRLRPERCFLFASPELSSPKAYHLFIA
jgi:hypothetical protein